ncbi:MAG: sulfatase-like hydrolase/transferase, partial [Spirochaetales bacterium]|nr:sulfatase-like hydrolase/transferase [Spirochaetales bacterium]
IVTRETLAFVREIADEESETPWFVCASFGRPHSPLTAPGRYIRRYEGIVPPPAVGKEGAVELETFARRLSFDLSDDITLKGLEGYYACVDFVDDCIGELINGLRKDGLLENTIVIYTSDHGEMLGLHGCWGKQLYHEPSSAVPLLISGPGIPEDGCVDKVISLADLFPTACGLAGLPVPPDLDGFDMSGLVRSPASENSPREFAPCGAYRYGVRINHNQMDENLPSAAWRSVRDDKWKYVEVEKGAILLFDLETDPLETINLSADPNQKNRCRRMKEWSDRGFSWELVHSRLSKDRERVKEYYSGLLPGTPNQYMLPDGRVFDAEKSLYDARWMPIVPGCTGGIIPQQFG